MSDLCCQYTYAGTVIVNGPETTDTLIADYDEGAITGLDGAPIRRQVDPAPQTDGGDSHPAFFGPRVIGFKGRVHIGTVDPGDRDAFVDAVVALEEATRIALEAQLNTSALLVWTPGALTAHSLSAMYGMPGGELQFGGNMMARTFQFTLIAENPTITIA